MIPKVRWMSGMKHRFLYAYFLCISTILCAFILDPVGRAEAADAPASTPLPAETADAANAGHDWSLDAAGEEIDWAPLTESPSTRSSALAPEEIGEGKDRQPPHDEEKLSEKAVLTSPSAISTDQLSDGLIDEDPFNDPEALADSSTSDRTRIDEINAAVSEALIAARAEGKSEGAVDAREEPPPTESSLDSRRQWLRTLVVNTPVPSHARDSAYVDKLRQEVSETLVMGEAVPSSQQEITGPVDMTMAEMQLELYQVKRGDSLWKIAKSRFGNGYQWQAIYDANREILRDTNMLSIGQMLRIPNQ